MLLVSLYGTNGTARDSRAMLAVHIVVPKPTVFARSTTNLQDRKSRPKPKHACRACMHANGPRAFRTP